MAGRKTMLDQSIKSGEELINQDHFASNEIKDRINEVKEQWQSLEALAKMRRKKLEDASELFQVT